MELHDTLNVLNVLDILKLDISMSPGLFGNFSPVISQRTVTKLNTILLSIKMLN